jgi:L-cysteine S-thiosulfotransferase
MQAVLGVQTAALAGLMFVAPLCTAGDAVRGAAIAASRSEGLCVLCHALPGVPEAQAGTLGPSLAGVGARLSADQLRERLLTPEQFNPATLMPAYARREGFTRVASARRGQPLLDARQIDDVVAYLASLQ